MAPPPFADLNKPIKDLLSKGYNIGLCKVEVKTTSSSGVKFTVNGTQTGEGVAAGSLESQYCYKLQDGLLTIKEKWNTANIVNFELIAEDFGVKGSKTTLLSTYSPDTGKKSALVKAAYKQANFHANVESDLNFEGLVVRANGVFTHQQSGMRAGVHAEFAKSSESAKSSLTKNSLALGWVEGKYNIFAGLHNMSDYEIGVHQRVNPQTELAIQANWSASNSKTKLALGVKHALNNDVTFKAKVDNNSMVGLSIGQKMRPGINLTLSSLLNAKNFNQGGHRFGVALEMEA